MSILYPRLIPSECAALFDGLRGRSLSELEAGADFRSDRAVFAASGGTRVSTDRLRSLRAAVESAARTSGYPDGPNATARNRFDADTARILLSESGMVPGEASQPQVWAFLALVVLPHVCAWRFPAKPDGSYLADRFKGSDLTRHALGRLWTRAYTLRDPSASTASDEFHLMGVLGEADLDQIMARRNTIAATPALVRAIVRAFAHEPAEQAPLTTRNVLRETLMRMLRLLAFLDVDGYDDEKLNRLVLELRGEAILALKAQDRLG